MNIFHIYQQSKKEIVEAAKASLGEQKTASLKSIHIARHAAIMSFALLEFFLLCTKK